MKTAFIILCVTIIGGMINMVLGVILINFLYKKKTCKTDKALKQIRKWLDILFIEYCSKHNCADCPLSSSTGHNSYCFLKLKKEFDVLDKVLKNQ